MTMREDSNHREIIKNMVLLRKHNTITASLKYLKKPTKQMQMFFSRLPNAWKQSFLIKSYSSLVIRPSNYVYKQKKTEGVKK